MPGEPVYTHKHILIVHGIGDQVPNETSLAFMNNFLRALPESRGCELEVDNLIESVDPPANATAANGAPARFAPAFVRFQKRNDRFLIGFSEVYWQDITNSYLMGEKKDPPIPVFVWAHSVNTRMLGMAECSTSRAKPSIISKDCSGWRARFPFCIRNPDSWLIS